MNDQTFSPDGLIRVDWGVNTGRMSHEIWSPCIVMAVTEEVLFDLRDGDIGAHITWLEQGTFRMRLRRYSREGQLDVWVDGPGRVLQIGTGDPKPIEEAQKSILEAFPWNG